ELLLLRDYAAVERPLRDTGRISSHCPSAFAMRYTLSELTHGLKTRDTTETGHCPYSLTFFHKSCSTVLKFVKLLSSFSTSFLICSSPAVPDLSASRSAMAASDKSPAPSENCLAASYRFRLAISPALGL